MRIVFFGTPAFAVPSLEALLDGGEQVVAVVTQPDRPRGRSHSTLDPSPVKLRAAAAGIPVLQPDRPKGAEFAAELRAASPDLGVVVAYGHVLKPEILSIPSLGMINVHASLLPSWRGAAPIQWSILGGDTTTGVTIMKMEPGLDSGPVILRLETPIGPDETAGQLTGRLATLGAEALRRTVALDPNQLAGQPQDHSRATLAPKIDHATARIRWDEPAELVARRIRAFDPVPGAWTTLGGAELIKCFRPAVRRFSGPAGSVLVSGSELVIAASEGSVALGEVKPAGRTRMPIEAWLRGHSIPLGTRFE